MQASCLARHSGRWLSFGNTLPEVTIFAALRCGGMTRKSFDDPSKRRVAPAAVSYRGVAPRGQAFGARLHAHRGDIAQAPADASYVQLPSRVVGSRTGRRAVGACG
jgi:hypothetical protein